MLDRAVPVTCPLDHHYMTGCRENIQTAFQDSLQAIGVIGAILGGIEVCNLIRYFLGPPAAFSGVQLPLVLNNCHHAFLSETKPKRHYGHSLMYCTDPTSAVHDQSVSWSVF